MGHLGVIATSVGVQKNILLRRSQQRVCFWEVSGGDIVLLLEYDGYRNVSVGFPGVQSWLPSRGTPYCGKGRSDLDFAFGDVDEAGYRIAEWMERRTGLSVSFAASRIL